VPAGGRGHRRPPSAGISCAYRTFWLSLTVKAILCSHLGPPSYLTVGDVEPPALARDEVRIRVGAAGVNFPDTLIIEGKYQLTPPLPFTPGFEVVGEIIELGADVKDRSLGNRVMALTSCGYGAFAEQATARASETVLIPDAIDDVTAGALYVAYGTAFHALVQRGALKPGETLVVLGGSGGVGLAAVEIGALLGARVIAVGRSEEKLKLAKAKGAAETIIYSGGDLVRVIRHMTAGAGASVCLDTIGGTAFDEMSRAMAWEGRLLVCGFTSGTVPKLPVNLVLLKGYQLVGVFWGSFVTRSPQRNRENFDQLLRWLSEGHLIPHIAASYPLERAADALYDLLSRQTAGKLMLTPFSV
jgi:NADPH2:quinone reductase